MSLKMSEHKPLRFKPWKDNDNCIDILNDYGSPIGSLSRIKDWAKGEARFDFKYNGFTSDCLIEIAIKLEELNEISISENK